MYKLHLILLLSLISRGVSEENENRIVVFEEDADADENGSLEEYAVPKENVVRCSRRFRPGSCTEPVESVWTYVYDIQNCTERLGCPLAGHSNRFKSYARCMQMCQPLKDVFTYIMSRYDNNTAEGFHPYRNHADARVGFTLQRGENPEYVTERATQFPEDYNDEEPPFPGKPPGPRQRWDSLNEQVFAPDNQVFAPDIDHVINNPNFFDNAQY